MNDQDIKKLREAIDSDPRYEFDVNDSILAAENERVREEHFRKTCPEFAEFFDKVRADIVKAQRNFEVALTSTNKDEVEGAAADLARDFYLLSSLWLHVRRQRVKYEMNATPPIVVRVKEKP